jgi:hypothetical protein
MIPAITYRNMIDLYNRKQKFVGFLKGQLEMVKQIEHQIKRKR